MQLEKSHPPLLSLLAFGFEFGSIAPLLLRKELHGISLAIKYTKATAVMSKIYKENIAKALDKGNKDVL